MLCMGLATGEQETRLIHGGTNLENLQLHRSLVAEGMKQKYQWKDDELLNSKHKEICQKVDILTL